MMYYDELARQDEQVLLTLTMDEEAVASCAARDPADDAAAAAVRTTQTDKVLWVRSDLFVW